MMWTPSCSSVWLRARHDSSGLPFLTVIDSSVAALSGESRVAGHSVTLVSVGPVSAKPPTVLGHVLCFVSSWLAAGGLFDFGGPRGPLAVPPGPVGRLVVVIVVVVVVVVVVRGARAST